MTRQLPGDLRPIAGFPGYAIARDRSVWSRRPWGWRPLKTQDPTGRCELACLRRDGRTCVRSVRKLWRDAFGADAPDPTPPPPPPRRPCNVRKLDDADVLEVRELRARGWSYDRLRGRYGVSKSTLSVMLRGLTYKHVPQFGGEGVS